MCDLRAKLTDIYRTRLCALSWEDSVSMPHTLRSSHLEWVSEAVCTSKHPAICKVVIYVDGVEEKKKLLCFPLPNEFYLSTPYQRIKCKYINTPKFIGNL